MQWLQQGLQMCSPRPHLHAEPFHSSSLCSATPVMLPSAWSPHVSKMLLCRPRLLMSEEPFVQRCRTLEVGCCDLSLCCMSCMSGLQARDALAGHKWVTLQRLEGAIKWLTLKPA